MADDRQPYINTVNFAKMVIDSSPTLPTEVKQDVSAKLQEAIVILQSG